MNALLQTAACLVLAGSVAAGPASRLGSEILLQRESGNGFALVDRATGVVRSGTVDGAGIIQWQHTVDTGMADVSDVSGGLEGASGELLAVTTPLANRVALIEIDAGFPAVTRLTPYYVGARGLSEIRSTGGPELLFSCTLSGEGIDDSLEVYEDLANGGNRLARDDDFGSVPVLEPLYETAGGPRLAVFARPSGGNTELGICLRDTPMLVPRVTVSGTWEFVTNARGDGGELLVVLYRVGSDRGLLLETRLPIDAATTFEAPREVSFPFPVGSVVPVAPGDPNMPDGVLVTSDDGSRLVWCRLPGGSSVSPEKDFDNKPAGSFIGAILVPGRGLLRFEGARPGRSVQSATAYRWNGGWEISDQSNAPSPSAVLSRPATLFYFDREPFTDEQARLLAIEAMPDWTRKNVSTPVPADVLRESFGGSVKGLGSPSSIPTHPPSGAAYILTNQVADGLSLSALEPGMGVFEPGLVIEPVSGSYPSTVTVTASYDDHLFRLFYRNATPAGEWGEWPGALQVAYSSDYYFVLVRRSGPIETGTIVPRSFQIATTGLTQADRDEDGVPDYVEQSLGLDPSGGSDSDGDGVSDLEEILEGSDPANPGSMPATRNPVPQGDGFELVGLPFSVAGEDAVNGVEIMAHRLGGALLGRAAVATIPPSELPGIGRGAWISASTAVPQDELVLLSSGDFFDVHHVPLVRGDGREVRAMIPVPAPPTPTVPFVPSGSNLAADAAGWIAGAQGVYATYVPVTARTDLVPDDTAVAVLVEAMVHAAAVDFGFLDGSVPLERFSVFADRLPDADRVLLSPGLVARLLAEGLDLGELLTQADSVVTNPGGSGSAAIRAVVAGVYAHHVANFGSDPGLDLPLDVLRVLFAGGSLPDNYAGAVGAIDLTKAQAAAAEVVAWWPNAVRPTDTWLVEIPETSPGDGLYLRRPDGQTVELFDAAGRIFKLEQERALVPGSQFSVTGFTDVVTTTGRPGMEVRQVATGLMPAASDRDEDGNLLDDEWERFFFGAIGQDPQQVPAGSSYPLLQHFLEGTDPRSGGGDEPTGEVVTIALDELIISPVGTGFDLEFSFPSAYLDRFAFHVEATESLAEGSFQAIPGTTLVEAPPGSGQVRISVATTPEHPRRFYRVRIALP